LSDDARIWTNAVAPDAYRPTPAILDLAKLPERIVAMFLSTANRPPLIISTGC